MLGHLIMPYLLAAGAALPPADCPSTGAVVAELERLGNGSAIAAHGTPEVSVHGSMMHIGLRGRDGVVSGVREVSAPASCSERASVAAVVLSAWVGAWRAGSFAELPPAGVAADGAVKLSPPSPAEPDTPSQPARSSSEPGSPEPNPRSPSPSSPITRPVAAPVVASAPVLPPAAPGLSSTAPLDVSPPTSQRTPPKSMSLHVPHARRAMFELGGFGFGMHDGDAGTWGGGMQAGLRFPGWLGLDAVLAGGGERERTMVRGVAAYRLYSLGLGVSAHREAGRVFADFGVLSDLTLLSIDGRSLNPGRHLNRFGMAVDARARLGFVLGAWRPFLFAGTNYALRAQRLTLDDYPEFGITLSRWNHSLGLGLAYRFASDFGETKTRQAPLGTFE